MADGAVAAAGSTPGAQAGTPQATETSTAKSAAHNAQAESQTTEAEVEKESPKGKQRLLDRYAKQYPDRKFEGDSADDDLYDLTADEFDKFEKERAGYKEKSDMLNKLFADFPDSAEIFRAMAVDKTHPFDYIIDNYGDILEDGLKSEDSRAKMKKRREDKAKRDAEVKENDEKFSNNIKESLRVLGEWGKKRGLDDKAQAEHFLKIRQALNDFADGNISEETYELFLNGANYANDVAKAKEEGEVNGRNAKIEKEFQQSKRRSGPPTLGGHGGSSEEYDEQKKGDILPIFGIPIKPNKK